VKELGDALRTWRDRITPDVVGLPARGPRRAAGLRREELAMLAGVSVDYVTRLEQSRATSPSPQVLSALARALRLSDDERDHLYQLAGHQPPSPNLVPSHVTPSVQRLLDQLAGTPVSVGDAAWNLVTWNPLWAAVFGEPPAPVGHNRNTIWRYFTDQPSRVQHSPDDRAEFEASAVADLRAATAQFPHDPKLTSLVSELLAIPRFARLWETHAVGGVQLTFKAVDHPEVGVIALDRDVLTVADSGLKVVTYTAPPGSETAEKLGLLAVIGTQSMSTGN
jgi:transcriptional regulator with XRE-family HTH domain